MKYRVFGTIKANIDFDESIEADDEDQACSMIEQKLYAEHGINDYFVTDQDFNVEENE